MFYNYSRNDKNFKGILLYSGSGQLDNPNIFDLNM